MTEKKEEGKRDSFIFYRSYYDAINYLKPEDQLKMFRKICDYSLDLIETEDDDKYIDCLFSLIKPLLDANRKRYLNGCKGGAKKGNKNAAKKVKQVTVTSETEEYEEGGNESV